MGQKNTFLAVLILVSWIANEARAENHVVGGSGGWETSTDLASWASSKTFKVGDKLVFKYSSGLHSMAELPDESAYKSCDLGAALDSKSNGNNVVKLSKAGIRYFACGTFGHCNQGMKVKIKVVTGSASSSPASPSTTSTTTSFAASTMPSIFLAIASLLSTLLL